MSGIVGQGTKSGVIGDFFPTSIYVHGEGTNNFGVSGNRFGFSGTRRENKMVWSDSNTKITPVFPGVYYIHVAANFANESPAATEDDSGNVLLKYNTSVLVAMSIHFHVTSSPTTAHEGVGNNLSYIHEITGTPGYYSVEYSDYTGFGGYNEMVWIEIIKIK